MDKVMIPLEDIIRELDLRHLTDEGGLWAQGYVSDETVAAGTLDGRNTDRPLYGTIYYLLTPASCSLMHLLVTDEIWYHHAGPAVRLLLIYPDGSSEIRLLGQDILNGERPQICVPRGTWQGGVMASDGEYTLMSTQMAPAYQQEDFTAGTFEELREFVREEHLDLLRRLTSEPVYR
ncbi:MAG: cupin domain-containing protein [Mogibacterium sp.]|nr:cupin domain-containing protein [Mogibacterium sp.]MBR2539408.1 cupin domain-containing protein [Mogibacterium sp.]